MVCASLIATSTSFFISYVEPGLVGLQNLILSGTLFWNGSGSHSLHIEPGPFGAWPRDLLVI